mgnify:CR=1 FL=1
MKEEIVKKLIADFPNLKGEIESNLNVFSEIYLHLIFGDVFNPYLSVLLDDPLKNRTQLIKAGNLLEYMSRLDNSIQEVVVTTVLERLSDNRERLELFSEFAGDRTRQFIIDLM